MPLISKEWQKRVAPYRAQTRRTLDSLGCEILVMVLVMMYAVIIFVDLAITVRES